MPPEVNGHVDDDCISPNQRSSVEASDVVPALVLQTDDITSCEVVQEGEGQEQRRPPSPSSERIRSPRPSYMMTKLSRASISDARLSVANIFATEVATFYDVFGVLGVPMLILFGVSAGWTFMLAAIQVHADTMANTIMKTTEFDNGEFWLLPKADTGIIIAAVVLLTLFGIGYTALAVTMVFFYHAGAPKEADLAQSQTVSPVAKKSRSSSIQIAIPRKGILVRLVQRGIYWFRGLSSDVCEHYFVRIWIRQGDL